MVNLEGIFTHIARAISAADHAGFVRTADNFRFLQEYVLPKVLHLSRIATTSRTSAKAYYESLMKKGHRRQAKGAVQYEIEKAATLMTQLAVFAAGIRAVYQQACVTAPHRSLRAVFQAAPFDLRPDSRFAHALEWQQIQSYSETVLLKEFKTLRANVKSKALDATVKRSKSLNIRFRSQNIKKQNRGIWHKVHEVNKINNNTVLFNLS